MRGSDGREGKQGGERERVVGGEAGQGGHDDVINGRSVGWLVGSGRRG